MAIEFECPVCGATIRVKDEAAGKKGRCPKCKTLLLVPDPGPEEAVSAEPQAASAPPAAPLPPVDAPAIPAFEPEPAFAPAAPAAPSTFVDPSSPFGIAMEPEPLVRPVAVRRAGGKGANVKVVSAAAGVLGIGVVLLVGWLLYRSSGPKLDGPMTGSRLATVTLEPGSFAVPDGVPQEVADRVMKKLATDELSMKSEYAAVTLTESGGRVAVDVTPGPQAAAVRVMLGKNAAVKSALAKRRKAVAETKREELETAAAKLFRDYDAYLTDKKPLARVSEHRDAVALNATTDIVGYAVEATIAGHPFRCVAEDADGNCYFFLPARTKTFRIRGRELPDGTTPLPVDFEVEVREGARETVEVETGASDDGSQAPETEPLVAAPQEAAGSPGAGESAKTAPE